MSKKNYYAVAKGRKTGIFKSWYGSDGAEVQVKGFQGAKFKGFPSLAEAKKWLAEASSGAVDNPTIPPKQTAAMPRPSETPAASSQEDFEQVVIYTDGGCTGNPGPGGYGAVILMAGQRQEFSGGYRLTTNNRMELRACIVALDALRQSSSVVVYSDSKYVVNGIMKGWAKKWLSRGWFKSNQEPAENPDLWDRLLNLCEKHRVEFRWVRGHAGTRENERCDQLAVAAAAQRSLPIDTGYERAG